MRQRGDLIIVGLILGFNSRTPGGVRLAASSVAEAQTTFQFTHPGRGATRLCEEGAEDLLEVSIHAPREGCDQDKRPYRLFTRGFNSRTPGGVRLDRIDVLLYVKVVSIHAPREGCDQTTLGWRCLFLVSIHAPREGCDFILRPRISFKRGFNSRTPGGVRHTHSDLIIPVVCVSIHAPREGCDNSYGYYPALASCFNSRTPGGVRRGLLTMLWMLTLCFNSRTPGGVRHFGHHAMSTRVGFQFTHPGRGATCRQNNLS